MIVKTYNASGQVIKKQTLDNDGTLVSETDTTYGANGKKSNERSYDGNGNPTSLTSYNYDSSGNAMKQVSDGDGNPTGLSHDTYGSNNKISKDEARSVSGNIITIKQYGYDKNNNRIQQQTLNAIDGSSANDKSGSSPGLRSNFAHSGIQSADMSVISPAGAGINNSEAKTLVDPQTSDPPADPPPGCS